MSRWNDLDRACADVLVEGLPAPLKALVDDLLARAVPPGAILAEIRRITGGPHAQPGGLTFLAVEAYLERAKQAEAK